MRTKRDNQILFLAVFIVSVVFYLLWYWLDGIVLTEDAQSYITMSSDREPGYCSFLAVLRILFGSWSLHAAVIIQCIVAALAAAAVTTGLKKRFSLGVFTALSVLAMQYGVTLLNRFVAQRRYSYYNSIETEGLCYSLWIFFFLGILGIIYEHDKKSIMTTLLWSIVLISIRKQMLITLIVLFLSLLYVGWKEKRWKKAFASGIVMVFVGLTGTKLIDCGYNFAVRGQFTSHSGDSSFILGTELYLADKDMAEYMQTEERRQLFMEIMRRADGKEYNIAYARKASGQGLWEDFLRDWQMIEDHYSLSYDRIKFDVVMAVFREYQDAEGVPEEKRSEHYNEIAGAMMRELLVPSLPGLARLFVCNVLHGMITTILKVHWLFNWAALLLYGLYVILFFYLIKKGITDSLPFAAAVLTAIAVNVGFTSVTIYPQMRYMLYNTALFYQAGFIMLVQAYTHRFSRRGSSMISKR